MLQAQTSILHFDVDLVRTPPYNHLPPVLPQSTAGVFISRVITLKIYVYVNKSGFLIS